MLHTGLHAPPVVLQHLRYVRSGAFTRLHLDAVHHGTYRDIAQRQAVAWLDSRITTTLYYITGTQALGCNDVSPLTIRVQNQRDMRGTIRIMLDSLNATINTIFITFKIDNAVMLLVTTTYMTRGDTARIIATT
jgi:hypothetical protein